jgi:hypothetical protein
MGGGAFGSGADGPFTPRMPPDVYRTVRDNCHAALRQIFTYVATPIEGPGKKDHGDIDVLVAGERRLAFPAGAQDTEPRSLPDLFAAIEGVLRVDHSNTVGNAGNFAIPWPAEFGDLSAIPTGSADAEARGEETDRTRHIQVDVQICRDFDDLTWVSLKCRYHSHHALWMSPANTHPLPASLQARPRGHLEHPGEHHPSLRPYPRRGRDVAADSRNRED